MKKFWYDLSYRWKMTIPILTFGIILAWMVYAFSIHNAKKNVIQAAFTQAKTISMQIQGLRKYYAENIVDSAQQKGVNVTHDYSAKTGAIPLPATMVHELNSLFSKTMDYDIRLYSNFPFPFRKNGGIQDEFGEEALLALTNNPDSIFWNIAEYNGRTTLRYASADRMVAQTCVGCHNSHSQSPKTDWKIGDVRGILEVDLPIDKTLASFNHDAKKNGILVSIFILVMIIILSLLLHYFLVAPLNKITKMGRKIAEGDLTTKFSSISADESGRILETICDMTERLNALIRQLQGSSALVSTSSALLSEEARQLESVVTEQAASANQIAATSTQISKTSDHLVKTMGEVSSMSRDTAESADSSQVHLDQLESTLNNMAKASSVISSRLYAINERATKITTVVKTISKVADQTNLISFNAGIESAKSGEQGRRFGVIAKEIRQLADQSAQASQDVKQMIEEMQQSVSEGITSIEDFFNEIQRGVSDSNTIRTRLENIIEKVQTLAPRFEAVSTGVETQSQGARLIQQSIHELSDGASEIANSLHQTNRSIEEINKVSNRFKGEIAHFKVD